MTERASHRKVTSDEGVLRDRAMRRGVELGREGIESMVSVVKEAAALDDPDIRIGLIAGYSVVLARSLYSNPIIKFEFFRQMNARLVAVVEEVRRIHST